MAFTTLVSSADLAPRLNDSEWIVFDCRHDLIDTGTGRRAYAQSHIPGARFLHLDDDLSGPQTGDNGRHPLRDPENFRARLAALGTANNKQVVHQCGSGVTACHNLLAMEIAGLHGSKLYPGSWSEWCSDPQRPLAR